MHVCTCVKVVNLQVKVHFYGMAGDVIESN